MSFPRYPRYKDSGVEWLGEVPEHWEVKRLKYTGEALIGLTYDPAEIVDESSGTLVLRSSNIQGRKIVFDDNVYVSKIIPQRLVTQVGDILICSRNGSRALIGKNAVIDEQSVGMTFGAFMTIFRSKHSDYLAQVFNSQLFEYQSGAFLTSTINQLTVGVLNNFEVPMPPPSERKLIAAFLDRETAKIDELVTEQQRLMELLKEKRQAVISHAVTKGLNPDAPMKPSSIEWLGEVPAHWEVRKIRWLFEIRKRIAGDLGFDVFSITQQGIRIKDLESNDGQISMDYSKYQLVEVGDFAMNHMDLLTGGVDIATTRGVTSPDYRVVTIRDYSTCHDRFFLYLFQVCYRNRIFYGFGQGSSQLGRWRLPTEQFLDFVFPLPSLNEQIAIASFLDQELEKIDTLTTEAQRAIDLLQERRAALISAAVTGQIDVRDNI